MTAGFYFVASSNVGLIRTGNEDAGLASNRVLAVADGMGGHAAGEVASAAVIQNLFNNLHDLPDSVGASRNWLLNEIDKANNSLADIIVERPETRGMGTTLSAIVSVEDKILVGHVGDSRVYRLRNQEISRLTKDHTYVQMLVDNGEITPAEAERHPRRNLMIRAIDGIHELQVDLVIEDAEIGDRFLVCSDGLSGLVNDELIKQVLSSADLTQAANQLIEFALAAGAPDNVTVIVAEYQVEPFISDAFMVGSAADLETNEALVVPSRKQPLRLWPFIALAGSLFVIAAGLIGWWNQQWYVGIESEQVVIYHGIPQDILGIQLSVVERETGIFEIQLNEVDAAALERGLVSDNLDAAIALVQDIQTRLVPVLCNQLPSGC